jgi:uncharacterized protein YndB with AHSA1/START domain
MSQTIEVTRIIRAPAKHVFEAWLDLEQHALMTGASTSSSDNGAYTAWDGYIEARTLQTRPHSKIVQSWRTTEFPKRAPDSVVTIELTEVPEGTAVKVVQRDVPDGQGAKYEAGWNTFYFDPMERYFSTPRRTLARSVRVLESAASEARAAILEAIEQANLALDVAGTRVRKAVRRVQKSLRGRVEKKGTKRRGKPASVARAKGLQKRLRSLVQLKSPKRVKKKAAPTRRSPPPRSRK